MNNINIKCSTGITLPLDDISRFPNKLKKHSQLEIERVIDSIENDGFLFPIAIGKVGDKNYVIDGEATFNALCELKYRGYEIPDIPVYYVKCNEETIKKMILIATSTNHCVTKPSIEEFSKGLDFNVKELAFNEGSLIDFYTIYDIDTQFDKRIRTITEKQNSEIYLHLLQEGEL